LIEARLPIARAERDKRQDALTTEPGSRNDDVNEYWSQLSTAGWFQAAAARLGSARLGFGLVVVLLIGLGSPAHSQIFWQDDYDYPDIYIEESPPPPGMRPQSHRAKHHRSAKPEQAAKSARKPKGPIIIAISIRRQTLKLYDANGLFAETPVSTGMPGHSTPMGVFSVIQKQKWHRSNIYSDAPMPYMQRITWSGIAMHAGVLPGYPASHGCIRMPTSFAVKMWGWTRTGARVIIAPGEVTPAPFSHPLLMTHRPESPPAPEMVTATATADGDAKNTDVALAAIKRDADTVGSDDEQRSAGSAIAAQDQPQPSLPDAVKTEPEAIPALKRSSRIAVLVSRKDSKIYVRQNFEPMFDAPVTITASDRPLGTHVFTAEVDKHSEGDFRWSVVSLPTLAARTEQVQAHDRSRSRTAGVDATSKPAAVSDSATEALDRISIPENIMTKIADALSTGDSIIVSDQGVVSSGETGEGTDFIVKLR
jgi:lipoprotein-anchoring transpeptidase ErfK/SrfK